jgi:hypothetical protein
MAPGRDVSDGTRVVEPSAEPEEIFGRLTDVGQDATHEEVVKAAFEAWVARNGWPVPRRRWASRSPRHASARGIRIKTTVPRRCETMVHETDTARLRQEVLVGLLIGIANGREIFALVQDAADSAAARAILRERRFGVPD